MTRDAACSHPTPRPPNVVDLGGLGFGVWGLGFGVWGLGSGVWGLGFRVWGLGSGVWGLGFRVWGLRSGIGGVGFGVWGLGSMGVGVGGTRSLTAGLASMRFLRRSPRACYRGHSKLRTRTAPRVVLCS